LNLPFPLNETTEANNFQLEVRELIDYSRFTGENNCEVHMTEEITFFNCAAQGGYSRTRDLLSLRGDFHLETGPKNPDLTLFGDSYIKPPKILARDSHMQTVSFMDPEKKEFRNFNENEFKEIEVEEFEDHLEVALSEILSIHRVDHVAIVHEAPNRLQLVQLKNGKMTEPLVTQTIVLNREITEKVMAANMVGPDRIIAQKLVGEEWLTLSFGLKKVNDKATKEDHYYLTQESSLAIPRRRWDGLAYKAGIFAFWNKQQSIYIYNEYRNE